MKNKDLITILENISPNAEIVVEVSDITTGNLLADIYDVDYMLNENGELKLIVAIEATITN